MKNLSKRVYGGKLLAILMCALLLLGMMPVPGAVAEQSGTGSLKVALKADTYAKLPKDATIAFTLYRIGTAAPDTKAGWKIDDEFAGYKIIEASTSEELGRAVWVGPDEIAGQPDDLSLTNEMMCLWRDEHATR